MRKPATLLALSALATAAPALAEGAPPSQFLEAMQACADAVGPGAVDAGKLAAARWAPPAGQPDATVYLKQGSSVSIATFDNPEGSGLCRIEGNSRLTGPQMTSALVQVFKGNPAQADAESATWLVAGRIVILSWGGDGHDIALGVMQSD